MGLPAEQLRISEPQEVDQVSRLLQTLTDTQREAILARQRLVEEAEAYLAKAVKAGRQRLAAINTFSREREDAPAPTTLRRWMRRYAKDGLPGLADNRGRPNESGAKVATPAAWDWFRELYLDDRRISLAHCHELVGKKAVVEGWDWPSLGTIRRRVASELDRSTIDYHRLGARRWHQKYAPHVQRDYEQYRPNQVWVGDHHEFDFLVSYRGKAIRPWLTAWLDMRSRMFTGYCICASPNSDTILAAFRSGVLEFGAPLEILIDNGKDYRARGFAGGKRKASVPEAETEGVCRQLGVEVRFAIPYRPESKPIERAFGTVCGQFSKLFPSYVAGTPGDRPEDIHGRVRAGQVDLHDLDDLHGLFRQWLDDHYHSHRHTGDGMNGRSPAEVFADDPIAKRTAPSEVLDLLLMKLVTAKVGRNGVRHDNVTYGQNNPQLRPLIGSTVQLRINPLDRGSVLVCDLEGRYVTTARNERLRGISQDEVREGMARQRSARRRVKQVLPAARDARKTGIEHALEVHTENARVVEQAATGTDDGRPVSLLPGAAGFTNIGDGGSPVGGLAPSEPPSPLSFPSLPDDDDPVEFDDEPFALTDESDDDNEEFDADFVSLPDDPDDDDD